MCLKMDSMRTLGPQGYMKTVMQILIWHFKILIFFFIPQDWKAQCHSVADYLLNIFPHEFSVRVSYLRARSGVNGPVSQVCDLHFVV